MKRTNRNWTRHAVCLTLVLGLGFMCTQGLPHPPILAAPGPQAAAAATPIYETRQVHDPDGTGKFYMGREIAQVMGPGGIPWLNRTQREQEEKPALLLDALGLHKGETVADVGAGSGYYTFRIAPKVGLGGKVLAVDIQDEMLAALRRRIADEKVKNVEVIKGSERDPHLAPDSIDMALMVDVYHELSYPYEVMIAIRKALKPGGRMVFVEFRKEDPALAIKGLHKMSLDQLKKEMAAVNLTFITSVETMPIQHIVFFAKHD